MVKFAYEIKFAEAIKLRIQSIIANLYLIYCAIIIVITQNAVILLIYLKASILKIWKICLMHTATLHKKHKKRKY